jgi:RNA polymerase sporulation-specific sigma factor
LEQLIIEYERLIYAVMKYFKNYSNKEDLFQVGCIGLINAYNNFNSNINVKFSTYAYSYILGEMKKLVREDRGIKISRNISKLYSQIDKTIGYLSQKLMRTPTLQEIGEFLEIDEYLVVEALNSVNTLVDIDNIQIINTVDEYSNILLREQLNMLSSEELDIITKRYMNNMTQSEVANLLGITQVQVSRKEHKVLEKLKKQLIA